MNLPVPNVIRVVDADVLPILVAKHHQQPCSRHDLITPGYGKSLKPNPSPCFHSLLASLPINRPL